jgi:hypothetical protein
MRFPFSRFPILSQTHDEKRAGGACREAAQSNKSRNIFGGNRNKVAKLKLSAGLPRMETWQVFNKINIDLRFI